MRSNMIAPLINLNIRKWKERDEKGRGVGLLPDLGMVLVAEVKTEPSLLKEKLSLHAMEHKMEKPLGQNT